MLTSKELRIVDLFRKNLFGAYTIRGISKIIGTGSYSWTYNAIKKMTETSILNVEQIGHSKLVKICLDSDLAIMYLSFLDEIEAKERKIPHIEEILKLIDKKYFTLIVTGSYAEGTQKKTSDVDVVVIVENKEDVKPLLNTLKNKGELMIPEIHAYVFCEKEFTDMLLAKEANYGKLIFKNRLVFFGARNYYRIINKAIKHGFTD